MNNERRTKDHQNEFKEWKSKRISEKLLGHLFNVFVLRQSKWIAFTKGRSCLNWYALWTKKKKSFSSIPTQAPIHVNGRSFNWWSINISLSFYDKTLPLPRTKGIPNVCKQKIVNFSAADGLKLNMKEDRLYFALRPINKCFSDRCDVFNSIHNFHHFPISQWHFFSSSSSPSMSNKQKKKTPCTTKLKTSNLSIWLGSYVKYV